MTEQPATPASETAAAAPAPVMTPAAALARHVEWLEFALGAARSEETWRASRLEKATKRNRDKRATRLAEVRDEITELSALLDAIRELQARPARSGGATASIEGRPGGKEGPDGEAGPGPGGDRPTTLGRRHEQLVLSAHAAAFGPRTTP